MVACCNVALAFPVILLLFVDWQRLSLLLWRAVCVFADGRLIFGRIVFGWAGGGCFVLVLLLDII